MHTLCLGPTPDLLQSIFFMKTGRSGITPTSQLLCICEILLCQWGRHPSQKCSIAPYPYIEGIKGLQHSEHFSERKSNLSSLFTHFLFCHFFHSCWIYEFNWVLWTFPFGPFIYKERPFFTAQICNFYLFKVYPNPSLYSTTPSILLEHLTCQIKKYWCSAFWIDRDSVCSKTMTHAWRNTVSGLMQLFW